MSVVITDKSFDPEQTHAEFRRDIGDAGAIVAFTGLVRGEGEVSSLALTHYPGFTEEQIQQIGEHASQRWSLAAWHVTHRVGDMTPREPIVFVVTASKHRRNAFEAADFIMDYLKSEAPFWKKEERGDKVDWIEPRTQDLTDIKRWKR